MKSKFQARDVLEAHFADIFFNLMIGMTKAKSVEAGFAKIREAAKNLTNEQIQRIATLAAKRYVKRAIPSPDKLSKERVSTLYMEALEFALKQTKAKSRGTIGIRVTGGKKAVKQNGGGARAPKQSHAEVAWQETAVKKKAEPPAQARQKRSKPETAAMPSPTPKSPPGASTVFDRPVSGEKLVRSIFGEFDLSDAPRDKRPGNWVSARPPEQIHLGGEAVVIGNIGTGDGGETDTAAVKPERRGEERKEQVEVLRRTPHMNLSPEAPLEPSTEFNVYVSVDTKAARPGEKTQDLELEGPASQEEFLVQATLVASGHFELREDSAKTMTILRSRESTPIIFKVRCVKEFPSEPDAALSALFSYEGHPSGRVTRGFRLKDGRLVSAPPAKSAAVTAAASPVPRLAAREPKVAVIAGLDPYDLTITVADTGENDFRHFRVIVDAPAIGQHVEVPWNLSDKTDQIVSNYMKDFVAEGLNAPIRLAQLKGAGVQLFRATPPEFQKSFWEMIDAGKPPKTILVVSDDPYIPWELMVPRRRVAGKVETRQPLGVDFCIGRWIRDDYTSPPQQIPLERTYVVAPNYVIASKNLKYAPQEAAFVCSSFKPSSAVDPADFDKIEEALRDKGVTLLHFICHGTADATQQTVYLRDMVNNLSASVVEGSDEFVTAFFRDHTFVFLNACEVGRTSPALVGVNGLPATFLRLGASGVVAALWSVKDDLAHQVAEKFYNTVLQQPQTPFAEILRDIRSQAYTGSAEDTYAAYCFYGSPLARRKLP